MLGVDLMKMFGAAGGGRGGLTLADDFVSGTSIAAWTLGADGFIYEKNTTGASVKTGSWLSPRTGMELYEVRVTSVGSVPSGTLNAWLQLSASEGWGISTTYAPKSCTLTVEVRLISNPAITQTVTVGLEASGIA